MVQSAAMNIYLMTGSKVKELFRQEHNIWLKKLELLQLEIVFLKNHIAVMVQKDVSPETLEKIEYFQTNFLNKDTIIALLRREIKQLGDMIVDKQVFENSANADALYKRQDTLRNDISRMEMELLRIKSDFKNLQKL
jgi:hypothetical protein